MSHIKAYKIDQMFCNNPVIPSQTGLASKEHRKCQSVEIFADKCANSNGENLILLKECKTKVLVGTFSNYCTPSFLNTVKPRLHV